jgi:hypothetical protein
MRSRHFFLTSRICTKLAVGVLGFFGLHHFGHARAATINAASVAFSDVSAAISQAVDGDTVIIPAGTATWTSGLTVTKGITLQGQTTTDSANGTASDQTIIVDNLFRGVGGGQGYFNCTTNTGQSLRITGITFSGVGGSTTSMFNGAVRFYGTSDQVRIDHCHFTALYHQPNIQVNQTIYGVADHNVFDNFPPGGYQSFMVNNGDTNSYGDSAFAAPAGYGGSKFFFIEDCYLNNAGVQNPSGGIDSHSGGKYVLRYSHLYDVQILCHGTECCRYHGGRAEEIYNNDYHSTYETILDGIRSGSLIAHDNTYYDTLPDGYGLQTYRLFYSFSGNPWYGASGDNPWDVNVTESDGVTHVDSHPPYLFDSGTATDGSQNAGTSLQTLTDTSKTWTVNQWAGYTAKRVSDNWIGQIISNTSNTLTMRYYFEGSEPTTFRSGDQYQIHKVLVALDQPGRGQGDLITGDTPVNSTTGTAAWTHQVLEPCYSWNNIHSPGGERINFFVASSTTATLLQSQDYFSDTPMPGYTPYTYPHPLVTGGNGPQAPGGLHIIML